ncbi:MAG: hypothetical protein QOJ72_167 [Nocardioidaceae bacterium]|nr:hypothetical protein [Nocardioidaceae bacterium]
MDRKALESATTANSYLRGLLAVPIALLAFLAALGNASVGPFRHSWVFLVVVALLAGAYLLINRYYNDAFGRATPSAEQQSRLIIATVVSVVVMIGVSTVLRSHAPWSLDLPVNEIAVAFALVLLVTFVAGGGVRLHHVVILGALAIAGLLPVWHGDDPGNIGLVMAGVAILLIGILDHVLLVRTLGPAVTEDSNAGA